jgi:NADPH2:quinone reductase
MMQHIDMTHHGGPEVLVIKKGSRPEPREGEVLIRVQAAGVNRPDIFQRQGSYPPPPDASPILGLEVAGEVVQTGKGVDAWSVDDNVCALTNGGGYAEFVAVPAGQCLPVPAGLSIEEAAALPETFFTVWANVFERAGLRPGEAFLVHGGSSGIGSAAIQMANCLGATVFTTAGSEAKCEACRSMGADTVINYLTQDYVDVVDAATDGRGVDVILDMVGGDYIDRNLKDRSPGRPHCLYSVFKGIPGQRRYAAGASEAFDHHRLYATSSIHRSKSRHRPKITEPDLAFDRAGRNQALDCGPLPLERCDSGT